LLLSTLYVPLIAKNKILFLLSAHLCLYEIFFPIWYFQGIEKMKHIAILNLVSRSVTVILIFIFVQSKNDYLLVPFFNGIGTLIASILAIYTIFYNHRVRFYIPPFIIVKNYFKESFPFFVSSLSTQLYTNANKLLIGIFLNMTDVAIYDLAEKITTLLKIPISLIGQTIYPKNVKNKDINFIKTIARYTTITTIFVYILVVLFAKQIVIIAAGPEMLNAVTIVNVLTFSIIPITIGHFFCTQTLIPFGYTKQYMIILTMASILYFCLILGAYYFNFVQIYQIAIITILVQTYIAIHSFVLVKLKLKIW
jgi:PST family polysaccharide transporter